MLFTALEVTTLKVRASRSLAFTGLAAVFLLGIQVAPVAAQRSREQLAPRIMVPTLQSNDKDLGIQAAEAIRARLTRDVQPRNLFVIPKNDIYNTLQASGYSTTEALGANDAKALANLLRADHYIDGTVSKTSFGGVRIDARLVLARDNTVSQLLPPAEGAKLDQSAAALSKSIQNAMRQLEGEAKCYSLARDQKWSEAIAAARSAISAYPQGTIAMICLGNSFFGMNQQDSVLAVATRISAIDPKNIPALKWAADIYSQRKDPREVDALLALLAADPTNLKTLDQVLNALAISGQAKRAVPFIQEMLRNNPGDPALLHTAWLVLLAAQEYPLAVQTGQELIRLDTAAADTLYYLKLAGAFTAMTQLQQAAQSLSEAVAKYPNNSTLLAVYAQTLQNTGQSARAAEVIRRALAVNPKAEGGYALLATSLAASGQWDSVFNVIDRGVSAGADKALLAKIALKLGNDSYRAGNASKNRADFQRAQRFLQLSDRLDGSATAKFLLGAASFSVGQSAVNEAQDIAKSNKPHACELARLARDSFAMAQDNVPAGLQEFRDAAVQLLNAIPQFTPAVTAQIKAYCR